MRNPICYFAILIALSSCMRIRPKDDDHGPENVTASGAPAITYEIRAGSEANQYKVSFVFDRALSDANLIKITGDKKQAREIKIQGQRWSDNEAIPGAAITYQFGETVDGSFHLWQELQVKIPQDLVVDAPLAITDKTLEANFEKEKTRWILKSYRRLFLTAAGRLTFNATSVRLYFSEIISDGGTIENFPRENKAPVGQDGRNGGEIEIFAENAKGTLHVDLRGENGGDGQPGKKPDKAIKGLPGLPGKPGVLVKSSDGTYGCNPQPTAGEPGQQGLPGYPGEAGHNGGSSGSLNFVVKKAVGFSLVATKLRGDAGHGGPGGDGGDGGDGGAPGLRPDLPGLGVQCSNFPVVNGPRGRAGIDGASGTPGQTMRVCETIEQQPKNCY